VSEKTNFSSLPPFFLVTPLRLPFTQKNLFGVDYIPWPHPNLTWKLLQNNSQQVRFAHFSKSLEKCFQSTTSSYTFNLLHQGTQFLKWLWRSLQIGYGFSRSLAHDTNVRWTLWFQQIFKPIKYFWCFIITAH